MVGLDLERTNLLSAGSLGSVAHFEGHLLSLMKLIETGSFDRRHVEEHVFSATCFDESKTLVRETLNCTFSHYCSFRRIASRKFEAVPFEPLALVNACSTPDWCSGPWILNARSPKRSNVTIR